MKLAKKFSESLSWVPFVFVGVILWMPLANQGVIRTWVHPEFMGVHGCPQSLRVPVGASSNTLIIIAKRCEMVYIDSHSFGNM